MSVVFSPVSSLGPFVLVVFFSLRFLLLATAWQVTRSGGTQSRQLAGAESRAPRGAAGGGWSGRGGAGRHDGAAARGFERSSYLPKMTRKRRSSSSLLAPSMGRVPIYTCLLHLLLLLLSGPRSPPLGAAAQSQPLSPARMLDATLQGYAYRALAARPRTGVVFNATLPANLTGVAAAALRLRSGSLRRRGFNDYFEFDVPAGVTVQPYVERVVLVYHSLGNWSEFYYPVPGYTYLAPVLGLLVYDAADLAAVGLEEQNVIVTGSPISVAFGNIREVPPGGPAPRCIYFDLNGVPQFSDVNDTNICSTYRQGHFSIVVNSSALPPAPAPAPAPAPTPGPSGAIAPPIPPAGGHAEKGNSQAWKIAGSVVGAAVGVGLLASLMICLVRHKQHKKIERMERNAEVGETFRMAQVGRTQAPVASGTRTQPVIESDYVA